MTELTITERALAIYKPPFYFLAGYIFDSDHQPVADDYESKFGALRVRGWGKIQYLENPEKLQDEVGNLIAIALTEFWNKHLKEESEKAMQKFTLPLNQT
jgi:hypothetical protein